MLAADATCPHCGAQLRNGKGQAFGRTATAVLMGLTLAGCPSDDDGQDSMGGSDTSTSSTMNPGTGSGSMSGSASTADPSATTNMAETTDSTTDESTSGSTFGAVQSAYGSPDTETFGNTDITDSDTTSSGSDTDGTGTDSSDTEGGSTSISPLYGASPSD